MPNDTIRRRAELLKKIEACAVRLQRTQALITLRRSAGLDTGVEDKLMPTELDFLGIVIDALKAVDGEQE